MEIVEEVVAYSFSLLHRFSCDFYDTIGKSCIIANFCRCGMLRINFPYYFVAVVHHTYNYAFKERNFICEHFNVPTMWNMLSSDNNK